MKTIDEQTLNRGTNLANSWCQLFRVEAGEIIKKGPQMFSLWNRDSGREMVLISKQKTLYNTKMNQQCYEKVLIVIKL